MSVVTSGVQLYVKINYFFPLQRTAAACGPSSLCRHGDGESVDRLHGGRHSGWGKSGQRGQYGYLYTDRASVHSVGATSIGAISMEQHV